MKKTTNSGALEVLLFYSLCRRQPQRDSSQDLTTNRVTLEHFAFSLTIDHFSVIDTVTKKLEVTLWAHFSQLDRVLWPPMSVFWTSLWLSPTSHPPLPLPWFPHLFYSFVMYILLLSCLRSFVDWGEGKKERKWIMEFSLCLTVLCNKILGVWLWLGTSPSKVACVLHSLDTCSYFWTLELGHMIWSSLWYNDNRTEGLQ